MTAGRRTALLGGLWFLATFVTSIPAVLLYGDLLDHSRYILGSGFDTQVALGAFLEVGLAVSNIATAVVLFPILRRQSQPVALGYVASRTLESTVIVIGIVSVMSVLTLRQDASGADPQSLVLAGRTLVAIHDWTFLLGPSFCAAIGNGILLGYLMYRSGLMPRGLALIGVIGGPLAFLAATLVLFDVYDQGSALQGLLTLPEIVWELSVGIYLTFKGFRSCPILTEFEADHRRPAPTPA